MLFKIGDIVVFKNTIDKTEITGLDDSGLMMIRESYFEADTVVLVSLKTGVRIQNFWQSYNRAISHGYIRFATPLELAKWRVANV